MEWSTHDLADRCANLSCLNAPGEGRFVLLVGDHPARIMPITLYVCAPCAATLRGDRP